MTNVTRNEIEACARLLKFTPRDYADMSDEQLRRALLIYDNPALLARAAKLTIDYKDQGVMWERKGGFLFWPADGTEAECIIKAASAVQLEREKQQ